MASTADRQRRHDEKWQAAVLDGMNRTLTVLHDISDGIRELTEAVIKLERASQAVPPPTHPAQSTYLTVADLAELLDVSKAAVGQMRYKNAGPPATKVGGRLRFHRRDVEAWLAEHREEAPDRTIPWRQAYLGGGIGRGVARTTDPGAYCEGSHTEPRAASRYRGRGVCRVCGDDVTVIKNGTLRKHRPYLVRFG